MNKKKNYEYRVVSVSIPRELDDKVEEIVKASKKTDKPVNKSAVYAVAIDLFISYAAEKSKESNTEEKKEELN